MKRLAFILLCLLTTQYSEAQNKKIYVSKQGGKPKLLCGFKLGYSQTQYTNDSDKCDSLICRGSGLERCFVDKDVFQDEAKGETKYYDAFNYAIRRTEKHIKRKKASEGELTLAHKGQNISVRYKNADKKGNADIEIDLL